MATYKKPSSLAVTQYLDKPGQFHFYVNKVDDQPQKQDGTVMDGIRLDLVCHGGTDLTQVKKVFSPLLFNPSESHRDGGEFATKVHLRLADACGLLPKLGADVEEVDIDWSKAAGKQIIAFVKFGKKKEGEEPRLEIDGAHIYHVDDPEAAHVPTNKAVLSLLPAALRRNSTDKHDARNQQPVGNGKAANGAAAANGANKPAGGAAKVAAKTQPAPVDSAPTGADVGGTVDLDNI